MPEAGTVVSHDIGGAGNIVRLGQIAVVALVDAVEPEEVGCGAGGGGGVFVVPGYHGDVVAKDTDGVAAAVHLLGENILVCQQSSKLQV
jgi:hypothetical protein